MNSDDDEQTDLIPVFEPALAAILIHAEDEKGSPLTYDEAITLRDRSACIMMTPDQALKMDEARGYCDIDPENCWFEWQMLRRELGREPELDAGAKVNMMNGTDPAWCQSIVDAQASLTQFRQLLATHSADQDVGTLLKTRVSDGQTEVLLWLHRVRVSQAGFLADVFEVPAGLTGFAVGQTMDLDEDAVLDWAVNVQGSLHGGFSIRLVRASMPSEERAEYDQYIGVTRYV